MALQHAKKNTEKNTMHLVTMSDMDMDALESNFMPKYGVCQYCNVPLEYDNERDEVRCPECGRVYDSFIEPYAELEFPRTEGEEEVSQMHRKISLADRYSIESEIRRKHLKEASDILRKAAEMLGLSASSAIVRTAQESFAKYTKMQKTRSDSLEITAYAALLATARDLGYAITEETLLTVLGKNDPQEIKKLAKQIRSKRREITNVLKLRTSLVEDLDQPLKLLEIYRERFKSVPILSEHVEAITQKVYDLWNKAKNDLMKLNKIPKSIITSLTYVAALLVLPPEKRVRIRQFDITEVFQTTPITIRDVLPIILKYLTPEERQILKVCMRRGRKTSKLVNKDK
ncbi:MAG: hypothetical protein QXY55_00070 [Candidatus Korarchaeota archaeon]|nr:hypothetical protein [Thermoproteota archaeon]MCR8470414.1 hypothetical protein [Thermoproteota archaeon]MCR8500963.1 hypothetical protein [Thermoproteota archaeon]